LKFELTILGSAAAIPAYGRFPSAQVLNVQDTWYMIDCGEGAQIRMTDFHIPRNKINHLFISHLHGDHVFGIFGLLTSYSLAGRLEPFHIFAPEGITEILEVTLRMTYSHLVYPLHIHTFDPTQSSLIFENNILTVHTIPLSHSIPCAGFLFREKKLLPNFRKEKIGEYNIPIQEIPIIKNGADFVTEDGITVPHHELTIAAPAPRAFAYCSDTSFEPKIIPIIQGIDMLYHEATFTAEYSANAAVGMHSTATQAATIAKLADVKMLVLGHYSARFHNPDEVLAEAKKTFQNSYAGIDGTSFAIPYRR
jgi:ribonuclease Z